MNPILLTLGPLQIRWYGVLFAIAFIVGYFIFRRLARQDKISDDIIDSYFIYFFLGIIIGARLGEVLFYEPGYYLSDPIRILYIWQGGLSSHGAIVGMMIATFLFARKHRKEGISFYKILDIVAIPSVLCAAFIRLGNFINGEIVGRVTDVPWAVKFDGYEGLRHPVQLYEAVMNVSVFGILLAMRRLKKIPEGFIFWSSIFIYSLLRFFIEFFKDYQAWDQGMMLTAGQYFSIALIIVSGYFLLAKYRGFLKNIYK